jgi:7-cyano-7-deazaguanine synthase
MPDDAPRRASRSALLLFSGGQDSATCLAYALDRYDLVETMGFAYGQRHAVELECRAPLLRRIAALRSWSGTLGADHLLDITAGLAAVGDTALTSETAIAMTDAGLPNTFVPGRNLLFLAYAGALAYRRGLDALVGGMGEADYSGYPDCRDGTIKAMQQALSLGMDRTLAIDTPLMWRDKAQVWALALALGGTELVDIIVELSHSCYLGDRTIRHGWGYGCGTCPACELRAKGWNQFCQNQ